MDEEPRKRPRPPQRRDENREEKKTLDLDAKPYRLRDDDEAPPRRRPRPVRSRDDDFEEDIRPRRRRQSWSVPSMDNGVRVFLWGLLIVAILIGFGVFGAWFLYRTTQTSPFQASMSAYLAAPTGSSTNVPHVVMGKMIVVDTAKKDVDWDVYFSLPDNLRAAKPQEVGTIVWTSWGKNQIDTYDNGAPAYVQTCQITVIDRKSQTIMWQQQYQGTEPPQTIDSRNSEGSGSKPTEQVQQFLQGLPRG